MTDTQSDAGAVTASEHRDELEAVARRRAGASAPSDPGHRLDHVTVENDDAPDTCTIHPTDARTADLRSTWITARGGSFVDLESAR